MRNLARNQQKIYYKLYHGTEEIVNDEGYATGNQRPIYGELNSVDISVSANKGNTEATAFGTNLDYDKTLSTADTNCEIDENTILWIENDPNKAITPDPYDYIVLRKAKSINQVLYAIKKVDVSNNG